jgi:broad specificity phosphatase PhoE
MVVTALYLIRHAETTWNAERRMQGRQDAPLSERGRRQVERLAEAMRRVPLAAVYASSLGRARRTAQPIADAHGLLVYPVDDLREIDQGAWEDRVLEEIEARDGDLLRAWWEAPESVRLPGGESLHEVQARSVAAVRAIAGRHVGRPVAVVAHGGVNKTILLSVLGAPLASYWRLRQHNACINLIEFDGAQPRVVTLNETAHLDDQAERRT